MGTIMIQKLNIPVSVTMHFDHKTRKIMPTEVLFEGHAHEIKKVGLHHTYRMGRVLFHVFSVVSESLFFKLVLNTETLAWNLEEIADGEAN